LAYGLIRYVNSNSKPPDIFFTCWLSSVGSG
jgi:hypothetical protein